MCNRYGYNHPLKRLVEEFAKLGSIRWDGLEPNAPLDQIRPTDRAPIIRPIGSGLELDMVRWGMVPNTWRGPVKAWMAQLRGNPLTNARAETVAEKPTFRNSFKRRRCLVPADGFYEWKATGEKHKQPFVIRPVDDRVRLAVGDRSVLDNLHGALALVVHRGDLDLVRRQRVDRLRRRAARQREGEREDRDRRTMSGHDAHAW